MNINHNETVAKYGFLAGDAPHDGQDYLAFVVATPLNPNGGPRYSVGRHIARGYLRDGMFMQDDGWIGWKYQPLIYHPSPVQASGDVGPHFVSPARWEQQLSDLIQSPIALPRATKNK